MSGSPHRSPDTGTGSPAIRVVSRGATDSEIAAVTAVLTAALDELAAAGDADESHGPTAWQRSQRTLRTPLTPGPGAWHHF